MPHLYRSPDEFVIAVQAALESANHERPVAVLVACIDPPASGVDANGTTPSREDAELLRTVANVVQHLLRANDHLGVLDDRFVIVLNNATAEDGKSVGGHICSAVRNHAFATVADSVTLSVGVASAPEHGADLTSVIAAATRALIRIEAQGRDGVGAAPPRHQDLPNRPLSIDRFAGRVQELASLTRWLDEACQGNPRVVSVIGETGTGTASLLRQLETEVRLRGGLFASAASSHLEIPQPYGVWSALLKATHKFPTARRREWSELQHLEPSLGPPAEASNTTGSQYRLLVELTEYVRSLASERCLVVVLDEMQWADSTSWDALENLIGQLDSDRLMVCLAQRPESNHETSPHRQMLVRHEIVRELNISRLTRDEVKRWLEAAFHRQQVGREFLAFLYRHTEGNPLFINQLLRSLVEEGSIWYSGTRWEWRPVSELRLPAGRTALIAERLSRFSSSTQAVLAMAAVIGREFDVPLLVGAGAGSEAAVRLAISEGVVAGLLHSTTDRKQGGVSFLHDEIVEVLVDSVPRDRIRQMHGRIARSFEKYAAMRSGEIAIHFEAAGEAADAYRWAQVAAKDADRVYAHGTAAQYLQLAARSATSPAELAEIRVALARVAEIGGRFDEVEELCDLAIEWFEGQFDERRALTIRRIRERARMELGQPALVTLDALVALDQEAERLSFDSERIALLMMSSQTHGRLGDQRTAVRIAQECVAMAETLGDRALRADALTRLGSALAAEAPAQARLAYADALVLFEAIGDVRGQSRGYNNLGIAALFESRLDDARHAFDKGIAVARAAGIPDAWGLAALNLGVLSQKCGEYDRARELFGEALGLFAAVKHSEFQLAALYNMAHVERELGLWESAAELYDATVPLAQRIGHSEIEIGAIAGAGLCLLELGRVADARTAAVSVKARMDGRPDWFQGREVAEALIIRVDAMNGRFEDSLNRFDRAIELADAADVYRAAWLTAACADSLMAYAPEHVTLFIERYRRSMQRLGYTEMTKRYETLAPGDLAHGCEL